MLLKALSHVYRYRGFECVDLFLQRFVFDFEFGDGVLQLQDLVLKREENKTNN